MTSTHKRVRTLRRPALIGLLLAAFLWLVLPGVASAHAHLTQSDPAPNSVIARSPALASFIFDEALNPALTRVRITDAAGRPVATSGGYLVGGHNGELWQLPLPRLAAGTYSVLWTSESATDGHVMSSFYTFRVAPSGGADRMAAVAGTTAGATAGGSGDGSGTFLEIGVGAGITALFAWVGQMAQALWLGALVIELVVLSPARRAAHTSEARLARAAASRLWTLVLLALVAGAFSIAGEVVSLALQGTGGDWAQALAPSTIGGIFSSQNGQTMVARLSILLVAFLVVKRVPVPARGAAGAAPVWLGRATRPAPQAIGIVAPALIAPRWEAARGFVTLLACCYMALVAVSGHAAGVSPLWLSVGVDWVHLVCTAAWLGGMAAFAYGVLPLRRVLPAEQRAAALLPLLDRFSPVAYVAVGALTLSGLYIATTHLHSAAMVTGTVYGHLLGLKSWLVGALIVLSASHVRRLRPLIAKAQRCIQWGFQGRPHGAGGDREAALATVHEGLATLAGRLRLEAGLGAGVLLITALLGQTLPSSSAAASIPSSMTMPATNTAGAVPATITGTAAMGDLRGRLTIAPPAVGTMQATLTLWEKGTPITADTGAAIIHLYPAAQPSLRATLTPAAQGTRFAARGSLAMAGTWRADVLVRTAMVNEYRLLPFTFTAGPGARFLTAGLSRMAGHHGAGPGGMAGM